MTRKEGRREKQNTTHWALSPVAKMPSVTLANRQENGKNRAFILPF